MDDNEVYIFEMTCRMPGMEPKTVTFRSKDYDHFLSTIKNVENALYREESAGFSMNTMPSSRKALIYKYARKLAIKMIKDGAFQADLFGGE